MTPNQNILPVPDLDWYRDVVENAPDTIIIVDRGGTILFHNNQAGGLDPASLYGRPIFEFFLPEFHQLVREKIERVFETGEMDSYELASEYLQTGTLWYMTRLGPIIRDEQVVAVSLFIRNTTELKQVQHTLSRMNDQLEQRVERRTQELNQSAYRLEISERLNAALRQTENRQEVLKILAGLSLSVLDADLAGIYLFKEEKLHLSISLRHTELPPASLSANHDRFLYQLLHAGKISYVLLEQATESDCKFCQYVHSQNMRALLVAPLLTRETIVGVLYVGWCFPRPYSPDDEQLLNTFVESGSNTLHRIQVAELLEQNIRHREHELHALYEIMAIANEEQNTETLLRRSLDTILKAVNCRTGVIHLADAADQKLNIAVRNLFSEDLYNWLQLSSLSRELWDKVYQRGQMVQVPRLQTQSYHETSGPGVTVLTYLGAPVRARDVTVGVLSLFSEDEALLSPGTAQLIGTIADQIGLALESTHQRQQEKEALILEERQRLARELHDSVSQSLYGLVLSADVGNKLLKLKAFSKLAETLTEIGEVALQSLKEMRLMLFELRPLAFEVVGLPGALELRLNTVERRAGMETSLSFSGQEFIPGYLKLEVYRIASEALNNSLKHARASVVHVSLNASPEQMCLTIDDNGKGFDHDQKQIGGFGLNSMKERSSRVGGSLTIDSLPDSGTRVSLVVPLRKETRPGQVAA